MAEIVEGDLATKQDVTLLQQSIKSLEETLEHKMLQMEHRMTIKIGTIITIVAGTLLTLNKLF